MKLNHVLIISSNLEKTNRFWTEVIGLELGYRPPFPFQGSWLYSEGKPLIHVALGPATEYSRSAVDHIALEGANYTRLIRSLDDNAIHYIESNVPFSGERQLFLSDPDGVSIEMIFPIGAFD